MNLSVFKFARKIPIYKDKERHNRAQLSKYERSRARVPTRTPQSRATTKATTKKRRIPHEATHRSCRLDNGDRGLRSQSANGTARVFPGRKDRIHSVFDNPDPCSNNDRNIAGLIGAGAGAVIGHYLGKNAAATVAGTGIGAVVGMMVGHAMDERRCSLYHIAAAISDETRQRADQGRERQRCERRRGCRGP
ncbi:MAG: glycine zipper domain-containing protein [Pararobbsia sp.]